MPRRGSLPSDLREALGDKPKGATISELVADLNEIRRFPVLPHSVRSALYQHLDGRGEGLFSRIDRGRYALRQAQDADASAIDSGS